jgi:large subunit ribosomal protein L21
MDYAILRTGSKQYTVRPGQIIDVDKLRAEEGSSVELSEVLAVSRDGDLTVGSPLVPNASVIAQVQAHDRDDKIIVFKYKRKVRYRRKKGHRQHYTRLAITSILVDGEEIGVQEQYIPAPVVPEEEALPEEVVDEVEEEEDVSEDIVDEAPEDSVTDELSDEGAEEVPEASEEEDPDGGEN